MCEVSGGPLGLGVGVVLGGEVGGGAPWGCLWGGLLQASARLAPTYDLNITFPNQNFGKYS